MDMSINFNSAEMRKCGNNFRISATPQSKECSSIEDEDAFLPLIPEGFFNDLPSTLKDIAELAGSETERDILLLGSMVCLSATFDNVSAYYDSRIVYPNLYLFVSAPAGVGKGSLNFCREIVKPIHKKLRDKAKREDEEYKKACKENGKNGNSDFIEEPKMRMFIIPANSSAASFQKILVDNNGIGLMFETEGDTLSQTLKRDYGQYSDILRKAFHHEPVTMSRKANREYLEVSEPKLSVILAGTPKQVRNLIPSAENGLMSRFIFYNLPFSLETRNVFAPRGNTKLKQFINIGETVCRKIEMFRKQGEFNFNIGNDNQETFSEILELITKECTDIDINLLGTAHRMGLIGFRIMMTLTVLRELDEHKIEELPFDGNIPKLICSKEDFGRTIMLMNVLTKHAIYMFEQLSEPDSKDVKRWDYVYDRLPNSFTKHDYDLTIESLGLKVRTAERWLKRLITEGKLQKCTQGFYQKIPP